MLTLHSDTLHFAFPEVYKKALCRVEFESALRVPDNDPPGPVEIRPVKVRNMRSG